MDSLLSTEWSSLALLFTDKAVYTHASFFFFSFFFLMHLQGLTEQAATAEYDRVDVYRCVCKHFIE